MQVFQDPGFSRSDSRVCVEVLGEVALFVTGFD